MWTIFSAHTMTACDSTFSGGGNGEGSAAANSVMHVSADGDCGLEGKWIICRSTADRVRSELGAPPPTRWSAGPPQGSSLSSFGSKSTMVACQRDQAWFKGWSLVLGMAMVWSLVKVLSIRKDFKYTGCYRLTPCKEPCPQAHNAARGGRRCGLVEEGVDISFELVFQLPRELRDYLGVHRTLTNGI
ncbi:hypothetical protein Tco_0085498 [Tanacetum coccineum]